MQEEVRVASSAGDANSRYLPLRSTVLSICQAVCGLVANTNEAFMFLPRKGDRVTGEILGT